MRVLVPALALLVVWITPLPAQRPSTPPQALEAPELRYAAVADADAFSLPADQTFQSVAAVDIDSKGHVFVLHRAPQALLEFDADGKFVRAFGEGLFVRSHGLRIDRDDNLWATDVNGHVAMKISPAGEVLMTLGTKGQAGDWDEAAGTRLLNEPNDVAIGPAGEIFVAQGHGRGEPRILKFDRTGKFIKSWGGRGTAPHQFQVAHSVEVDAQGRVYVADRENRRIAIFDGDGNYLQEWKFVAMPCGLYIGGDGRFYMTTGFDAQIAELDSQGKVLGAIGKPGEGLGEYGEAHYLTMSSRGEIYVSDTVNRRVQKYVTQK